jgi:dihydroorotate dehydrogenase
VGAYRRVVRPLLFGLPADRGHDLAQAAMRLPGAGRLMGAGGRVDDPRLATSLAGLALRNPVGLAPGLDKNGSMLKGLRHLGFGYIVVGSATLAARRGNPRPRLVRYPDRRSLANSMGLPNRGVDRLVEVLRGRQAGDVPVIASVCGFTPDETLALVEKVAPYASGVEIGLVCPNTTDSVRMRELENFTRLAKELPRDLQGPLFVKLPPDHSPQERAFLLDLADVCVEYGIDGVCISGGREMLEPKLAVGRGSLAGRATYAAALDSVTAVAVHTKGRLAIKASGGIFTGEDAAAMLRAGATTVEVYSAFVFEGPQVASTINRGLLRLADAGALALSGAVPPPSSANR